MPLALVADDDRKVCGWLRAVLEVEGYRVIEPSDGRQTLATVQRESPDLVILDVYLDGLDTIRQLCLRQPLVKVLAISGHPIQAYDLLKIAAIFGAHSTLEQPFSVDRLLLGVRAMVGPARRHAA